MSIDPPATPESAPRYDERYSHISVSLRYLGSDAQWHAIKALGWNMQGFHFYSTQELAPGLMQFKRGLSPFRGKVVWRARQTDPEATRAMLVNEILFHKIRELLHQPELHARLVRLLRAPLLTAEKCQVLATFGVDTSDATLSRMLVQRQLDQNLFRYGVRVDSEFWRTLVSNALSMSSVVLALESLSSALGPL